MADFFLVCFDSLPPSQHFSAMSGQILLGCTSTKQLIKCLAQGDNTVTLPVERLKLKTL